MKPGVSAKTEKKEKALKLMQERIKKQQEDAKLKLAAREQSLKARKELLAEKEKEKKVKAAEAEKANKERRMSCMYPLQSHAVTTAQLCFPVCPTLHVRMIADIIGQEEASRGKKAGCPRKEAGGERQQTTGNGEDKETSNRKKGGGSRPYLEEPAARAPRRDGRQAG